MGEPRKIQGELHSNQAKSDLAGRAAPGRGEIESSRGELRFNGDEFDSHGAISGPTVAKSLSLRYLWVSAANIRNWSLAKPSPPTSKPGWTPPPQIWAPWTTSPSRSPWRNLWAVTKRRASSWTPPRTTPAHAGHSRSNAGGIMQSAKMGKAAALPNQI